MNVESLLKKLTYSALAVLVALWLGVFVGQNTLRSKAAQPKVDVTFTPTEETISHGVEKLVSVILQPQDVGSKISAFNLVFNTQGPIQIVRISAPSVYPSGDTSIFTNVVSSGSRVAYVVKQTAGSLPSLIKIDVSVVGVPGQPEGPASLTLNQSLSQIVGSIAGQVYDFGSVQQTNYNGSLSGTPGGGGNTTLNLKVKFQGILSQPATSSWPVRVILVASDNTRQAQTVLFTADDNGIWSGTTNFNTTGTTGYKILIKGPKHLQKQICDARPTETFPGTYRCSVGRITINPGVNDLDLSGVYTLVGDLPEQDGIVNSYDVSLVRNNLGKSDAEALKLADLNLDGIVDTQDYSLVIAALSIRTDEGDDGGAGPGTN